MSKLLGKSTKHGNLTDSPAMPPGMPLPDPARRFVCRVPDRNTVDAPGIVDEASAAVNPASRVHAT